MTTTTCTYVLHRLVYDNASPCHVKIHHVKKAFYPFCGVCHRQYFKMGHDYLHGLFSRSHLLCTNSRHPEWRHQ
jgi:hypothetical protein